ncbi:hypothetical protein GP486_006560 [Trichoglossum hirsutum]|uniref:DUF6697 domain-containing protein n=1 Tax=Trichoglossum hirsutum TaxID=265104 RepID=A0A9P8L5H7_9PEZI|nr:hypothetical protein GP486_006560 [Trichoglossum hirsutum]
MSHVKRRRPTLPAPTPTKRAKAEKGSRYVPASRNGPIVIDDDSDSWMEGPHDKFLTLLEEEVSEFDKLIEEASRRHDVQHGGRIAAKKAMTLKHSLEEQAEQEEMNRLNGLRAKSIFKLSSYLRKSSSRVAPSSAVPAKQGPIIKLEHSGMQRQSVSVDSSRSSSTCPLLSPVPTSSATISTLLDSPSDRSRAVSASGSNRKTARYPLRKVKKEQEESGDEDYVDVSRVNSLVDPTHTIWDMEDSDESSAKEIKRQETPESDIYDADDVSDRTTAVSRIGRKRKLTKEEFDAVPRIPMPEFILSLNNDYHTKLPLPETSVKFSRRFLTMFLGGNEQETYVNISNKRLQEEQVYPITRYYCFCPMYNPQVPPTAGRHGAGLTIGGYDTKPILRDLQQQVSYFIKRRSTEWE